MNTSGCPSNFANDGFFAMGTPISSPCSIPIPFYIVFLIIAILFQAVVAYNRTRLIARRVLHARKQSRRGHLSCIQMTTLVMSWMSILVYAAILIVPLVYGDSNNVMIFLFELQVLVFQIGAVKWADKLVRLGSRIIYPKQKQTHSNEGGSDDPLGTRDLALKVMGILIRLVILFEFICLCILCMVYQTERIWLWLGIGMLACFTVLSVSLNVYQYQRCKNAILMVNQKIEQNVDEKERATLQAVSKFRKHQIIQTTGIPCAFLFLLWSVQVIPMSFGLVLFCIAIDLAVNSSMLFTFLGKRKGKSVDEGSKIIAANGDAHFSSNLVTLNESRIDSSAA